MYIGGMDDMAKILYATFWCILLIKKLIQLSAIIARSNLSLYYIRRCDKSNRT